MSNGFIPSLSEKQLFNLSTTNHLKCHTVTKEKCKKILQMCVDVVVKEWFHCYSKILIKKKKMVGNIDTFIAPVTYISQGFVLFEA